MTLSVHGVHCDLGDALKQHVSEKLQTILSKLLGRDMNATVTFSKTETKGFRANVVAHVGHKTYQADATDRDAHKALDVAANKVAKQLRREKARIRDDHGARLKGRLDEMVEARSALA